MTLDIEIASVLSTMLPTLRRLLIILVVTYAIVCLLAFLFQRRLMYFPDTRSPSAPLGSGVVDVTLETSDGVTLEAWYWPGEKRGTAILFHGNAGNRGNRFFWMHRVHSLGYGVLVPDYRGYGGSGGVPTEEGLYLDGEAALAWLGANVEGPVVIAGTSIGGGPAVEMARRHPPAGLLLTSSAPSTASIGQRAYPFLPVGLLVRDRFESRSKIADIACPLLMLHGSDDEIVPVDLGRVLFEAASEPKRFVVLDGVGHNDVWDAKGDAYWNAVRAFLDQCFAP